MHIEEIKGKSAVFKAVTLPLTTETDLLVITAPKGYVMCGYLNIDIAEKKGSVAAIATGVKNTGELYNAKIVAVTSFAKNAGLKIGMKVSDALELMA